MPLSVYSYVVYGASMVDSVIDSVQLSWVRYFADMSIACHCILTIIIIINPINLQLEETFNVPQKFCWQRVVIRTIVMSAALFVALSLPDFSALMNLFGSTSVPCTCVILPCLYELYIRAAIYDEKTRTWILPTFLE
ncbi:unnamed protein product [Gongylonema pulchrum]|uniref:Aa_trans domain-containing protein n=1 Tax=Gongylonema pulchrum TaxID=637853 RepID=A0A183E6N9_9BILA|nr:unnamed protein product [Gongylonema pulchrum]